jgi:methyltransferase (TIGR00027 family)
MRSRLGYWRGAEATTGRTLTVARRTRPSMTARNVAGLRRQFDRPVVATGDAPADDALARAVQLPVPWCRPGLRAYLGARTRFFDLELLRACDAGIRQVVIAGAGYDGRALRFRRPDVSFLELDHPVTQGDKRRRLAELGVDVSHVRFVPVDFARDAVDRALMRAGHDDRMPTCFLCEGVTPYLHRHDLVRLLQALHSRAAPGSPLAIDFARPPAAGAWWSRMLVALWRASSAVSGERVVTVVTHDEIGEVLLGAGWERVSSVDLFEESSGVRSVPAVFITATTPRSA